MIITAVPYRISYVHFIDRTGTKFLTNSFFSQEIYHFCVKEFISINLQSVEFDTLQSLRKKESINYPKSVELNDCRFCICIDGIIPLIGGLCRLVVKDGFPRSS